MRVRPAELEDLEDVSSLTVTAYRPWEMSPGFVPMPAAEDYAPRIRRGDVTVAERNDLLLGVLVLEHAPDHLLIWSIAVHPDAQGTGVGTALLGVAGTRARTLALPTLRLFTNSRMTRNLALYRRWAFHETGRRPHPTRPGQVLVDLERSVLSSLTRDPE